MLHFQVFQGDAPARQIELQGSYGIGAEAVPTRVECHFSNGQLRVGSRGSGPIGLALLWSIDGFGKVLVETTRLPGRQKPYILNVELARWRLQRLPKPPGSLFRSDPCRP